MVSLWWVAAAFFVGGYAGVVLVAAMSMAARQTAMPANRVGPADHPLSPRPPGAAHVAIRSHQNFSGY
jgi:hypothetical protein